MGTPLSLFTGVWFSLFGGAVIWWCAAEVRLRRTLRRVGVRGMARVVDVSVLEPVRAVVGGAAGAAESDPGTDPADAGRGPEGGRGQAGPGGGDGIKGAADGEAGDHGGYGVSDVDHADTAPMLSFDVEGHGEVVTRPRGWTSIRRSSALAVGTLVPVAYDPKQPTRVALEGVPQSRSDLFWLLLGLAFAASGVTMLATAF